MEKRMQTTVVYWGCIGIMQKKWRLAFRVQGEGLRVWDFGFRV